ncbi:unnamed protein product [Phytomonas sp. Hart1]|nr:unnamed protein product [Phytomonas sp. Hart1]|eukprot:CCW70746.1 unnamed protein product [Phytomonas sp. isolate Hart1]
MLFVLPQLRLARLGGIGEEIGQRINHVLAGRIPRVSGKTLLRAILSTADEPDVVIAAECIRLEAALKLGREADDGPVGPIERDPIPRVVRRPLGETLDGLVFVINAAPAHPHRDVIRDGSRGEDRAVLPR